MTVRGPRPGFDWSTEPNLGDLFDAALSKGKKRKVSFEETIDQMAASIDLEDFFDEASKMTEEEAFKPMF